MLPKLRNATAAVDLKRPPPVQLNHIFNSSMGRMSLVCSKNKTATREH